MGINKMKPFLLLGVMVLLGMSSFQLQMNASAVSNPNQNPNVPCTSAPVVSIFQITDNRTGSSSFKNSPFSPGITPPPGFSKAMKLDGSASGSNASPANSISVKLSTTKSNDVIYLALASSTSQSSLPSVKDAEYNLAWQSRTHYGSAPYLATFAAIAKNPLSSDTITVTVSNSAILNVLVFGITGANTQSFSTAFDENTMVPAHSSGSSSKLSTKVNTFAYDDMIIGIGVQLNATSPPTLKSVSPFQLTGKPVGSSPITLAVENDTVSTWESGLAVKLASSVKGPWVMIADAISMEGGPHGGGPKRWLTNATGSAPSGWVPRGPACSVRNGQQPSFVEIDNVLVSALRKSGDCSSNYVLLNGGGPMTLSCDYVFNVNEPSVNPAKCTTSTSSACWGVIHVEIDQDWQAAGYCSSACNPGISVKNGSVVDIQGFVYWDPEAVTNQLHSFSGWEIHPMTYWACISNC